MNIFVILVKITQRLCRILDKKERTMNITIGADPEVFVTKDNEFVSAHKLIRGTKEKPYRVTKGAVQVDGMALEFNIDPSSNKKTFLLNIKTVLSTLEHMVPNHKLSFDSVAYFNKKYLASLPEEATDLGCDPDFNAWTGKINTSPDKKVMFRTAAGHIHIGWTEGMLDQDPIHFDVCKRIVKQLDYYLGLPSVLFDKETKRRELYGKAGAFRPKSYGVEYRVLSNRWLTSDTLIEWVYDNTMSALNSMRERGELVSKCGDIQDIINNSDLKKAEQLIKENEIGVPNV